MMIKQISTEMYLASNFESLFIFFMSQIFAGKQF